jgi:membrane fusion protein (multidrug efflux system)
MENLLQQLQLRNNDQPMKNRNNNLTMKSTIYTRLFAVALAGVLVACSATSSDDKKKQLDELKKEQADLTKKISALEAEIAKANPDSSTVKTKDVSVAELSAKKFDHYVQTQGSVDAEENINVTAKSPGTVIQVYVTEGQAVSKGQILAQLDNSVIKANVEGMKAQLQLATTVYERQKNLWDQKIGTEVQFLKAKTDKEALEKQVAATLEQEDMTKIKAPISGTVDAVFAKVGEAASGLMPSFRVINTSNLKIKASVSEAYVTNIKKGNKVLVDIPEVKKQLTGQVTFVGKTIDPLSRTFAVEVSLPNNADLRPNMTAMIKVVYHTEASSIVVPVNVIQAVNNEKVVYVAEANGKQTVARKKKVTVDGVFGNEAQVVGLKAGDKVITVGYQGLNDGDPIKL